MYIRWRKNKGLMIQVADYMIENNATCDDIEKALDVPHSSVWWMIQRHLPWVDYDRAERCKNILFHHKHYKRRKKNGRTA